jgi:bifunctional DNase/RNase
MVDPVTNTPIVILRDTSGNSILPIWVGVYEANAIALEIEKVTTPRPMTHDLIKNLLTRRRSHGLAKVVVSELKDETFYAVIWLEQNGELISVDSRPSDALALALRLDCPIYVEEQVLQNSRSATNGQRQGHQRRAARWLEGLNDEDLGRYKMSTRRRGGAPAMAGRPAIPLPQGFRPGAGHCGATRDASQVLRRCKSGPRAGRSRQRLRWLGTSRRRTFRPYVSTHPVVYPKWRFAGGCVHN